MPNDGTGTGWDEAAPSNSGLVSQGPQEIRDLRKGLRIRLNKEHVAEGVSSAGGEHKMGSGMVYHQEVAPTLKPDAVTALDTNDEGRLWIKTSTKLLYFWDGTAWVLNVPSQTVTLRSEYYAKVSGRAGALHGGTFASGGWKTRPITNTDTDSGAILALATNRVTLQAGTYRVRARCAGYRVDRHQCRFWNITDNTLVEVGSSERSDSTQDEAGENSCVTWSEVVTRFTISGAKAFELQHICETTKTTTGMGIGSTGSLWNGLTYNAVFSTIEIWKEL